MGRLSRYRVLLCGVISPPAAIFFYAVVNGTLMKLSPDHEKDWLLRLSLATLAMTVPFLVTLTLAIGRRLPLLPFSSFRARCFVEAGL